MVGGSIGCRASLGSVAWACRLHGTANSRRAAAFVAGKPEDLRAARSYLANLSPDDVIPRRLCAVSFSRSSGPGGQNVNKVNSKVTVRVPLDELLPRIPSLLHSAIRNSRFYASQSDSLVIQADDSRKQADNERACFRKLFQELVSAGAKAIPGETSEAQKQRVKTLEQADNERRIRTKKVHSGKKSSRRSRPED